MFISRRSAYTLAACLALPVIMPSEFALRAAPIYFNDFQAGSDANWSSSSIFVTSSGRSTLGAFGNETVTLTLTGLPAHTSLALSFDLFVNGSWDGNGEGCCGPDVFDLNVAGGPTLLHTTFANGGGPGDRNTQAYPDTYPGGTFAPLTGATENPYAGTGTDFVYHLTYIVPDSASSIQFRFSGSGLQALSDESWSLDNVRVDAVPEPGTGFLFAGAVGVMAVLTRRFRSPT